MERLLASIKGAVGLVDVDLSHNPLTESEVEHLLGALKDCKALRHLDLSGLTLTDQSMLVIKSIMEADDCRLHALILQACNISTHGLQYLHEALSVNKSLVKLDVSYNKELSSNMDVMVGALVKNKTLI